MAKSDKGDIYNEAKGQYSQAETRYNELANTVGGRGDTTWDRATEDYTPAFEGYKSYAEGGGLKPEDIERMRNAWGKVGSSGGGGGYGGWSAPQLGESAYKNLSSAYSNAYRPDYGESDTGFRRLADQGGGFDEEQLRQIYGNIGQLSEMGRTGGITDADRANISRKSLLEQEMTGGYSEQDKALIRAKSAASSPAYFSALKDNLQRQRSQTGNLANAGAVDTKLARQGAQQQGQDRLAQEMALQESVRAGKERAGQFLSDQEMQLTGLRTANQLSGARSAAETGTGTQAAITANQQRALQGLQESQTGLGQWGLQQAGGLDYFGLNRAGGLDAQAQAQAQLEAQARASNAAGSAASGYASARDQAMYEQWVTQYGNEQKQYGIGGLESLYNTNLGASQNYSQLGLSTLNSKYGTQGNLLGLANQVRGRTAMENAGTIGGLVGNAASLWNAMGGGGGGKDNKSKTQPNTPPATAGPGGVGDPYGPGGREPRPGYGTDIDNMFGGRYGPVIGHGHYNDSGVWIPDY